MAWLSIVEVCTGRDRRLAGSTIPSCSCCLNYPEALTKFKSFRHFTSFALARYVGRPFLIDIMVRIHFPLSVKHERSLCAMKFPEGAFEDPVWPDITDVGHLKLRTCEVMGVCRG